MSGQGLIPLAHIEQRVLALRGQRVMIGADLTGLLGLGGARQEKSRQEWCGNVRSGFHPVWLQLWFLFKVVSKCSY